MSAALTIPGLEVGVWQKRDKSDPAACALLDRHYSRQAQGSNQVGPPGRKLILVTPDERAVWLSHWPLEGLAFDELDAWRCSAFRNEGAFDGERLSSELIVEAMVLTAEIWLGVGEHPPDDGWVTWIDTNKVSSSNPGYCFKKAGWWVDHSWQPARGRRGRIRMRAR